MIPFRPVTSLNARDMAALLAMPDHPVHLIAMRSLRCETKLIGLHRGTMGDVEGYLIWKPRTPDIARLDFLCCSTRKRGCGSALVDAYHADITHKGYLVSEVVSTLHAREFYKKFGYRQDAANWLCLSRPMAKAEE